MRLKTRVVEGRELHEGQRIAFQMSVVNFTEQPSLEVVLALLPLPGHSRSRGRSHLIWARPFLPWR